MFWWLEMKKEPLLSRAAESCAWCGAWTGRRWSSMCYWSQPLMQVKQMGSLFWWKVVVTWKHCILGRSVFMMVWSFSGWRLVPKLRFRSLWGQLGLPDVEGSSISGNQDFVCMFSHLILVGLATDLGRLIFPCSSKWSYLSHNCFMHGNKKTI